MVLAKEIGKVVEHVARLFMALSSTHAALSPLRKVKEKWFSVLGEKYFCICHPNVMSILSDLNWCV